MTSFPFSLNHVVFGNGESRKLFTWEHLFKMTNYVTWGCNAIYRDIKVDNLVVADYGMQQEIVESGYARKNKCYFANWNVLPSDPMLEYLTHEFKPEDRHFAGEDTGLCVIQGSHAEKMIEEHGITEEDKINKIKKDNGIYVTYIDKKMKIEPITDPDGWSAGTTAIHLACQEGAEQVYMFGFDLSTYGKPINNIYKGTKNYLSAGALGFNPVNWKHQLFLTFSEFSNVKFKWIFQDKSDSLNVRTKTKLGQCSNVEFLTYDNIR